MKKRKYPKTVSKKKIFKASFWTVFGLVLFLSVVAIVRVGNAGANVDKEEQADEVEEVKINLATREGAQSFAENFAIHYFNWTPSDEAKKQRAERLEPYLAKGLDEQAGLGYEGMEWSSSLTKSQIWNVEETGENTANITLRLMHELKKSTPPDPAEVEKAKKDKKEPPKATEEKAGPFQKYFVIPIATNGESFVVHEIPYFVTAPEKPDFEIEEKKLDTDKITDSELQASVTAFLNTFFKNYTTGTQDELSYYIKGESIKSMTGIVTFVEVKDIAIKKGEGKKEYLVNATVIFSEDQSKAQLINPYELNLIKEDDRWLVKEISNK